MFNALRDDQNTRATMRMLDIIEPHEFKDTENEIQELDKKIKARYVRMIWCLDANGVTPDTKAGIKLHNGLEVQFYDNEGILKVESSEDAKKLSIGGLKVGNFKSNELEVITDFGEEKTICKIKTNTPLPFIVFQRNEKKQAWQAYFIEKKENAPVSNEDNNNDASNNATTDNDYDDHLDANDIALKTIPKK